MAHLCNTPVKAWAEEPGIDGWAWDRAGGHKGADMQAIGASQVVQPSYVPELNPVECFFQELRRALGDRVYPTPEAKKEVLGLILKAWQADLARVRQLCGWLWIREALGGPDGPARQHAYPNRAGLV